MKIASLVLPPGRSLRLAILLCVVTTTLARAQSSSEIESLVQTAVLANPSIQASVARVEAARAAVGPASARPDPMLMVGVVNFPLADPGFGDEMTMTMVGIEQTLPYPGKLALRRRAAELEVAVAETRLRAVRLDVESEVKDAFYELAFLERALEVLNNNQTLIDNLISLTTSRYGVGVGEQQDVLRSRVESARLAEEAVMLNEARTAVRARLNGVLARPSDAPIGAAVIPAEIVGAAVAESVAEIRFASSLPGARAAGSRLPSLSTLQRMAVENSPVIRERLQMIAIQAANVELSARDYLPDFDVSIQYGQRARGTDMVTALVSIPFPLQRGSKQDLRVAESRAELTALEAELSAERLKVEMEVAALSSMLEQARAQLALFKKAIIPQGQASLQAATASFQVGRADFMTLLDSQATLFEYESTYHRLITDFAQRLAELERVVGTEVL